MGPEEIGIEDCVGCMEPEMQDWPSGEEERFTFIQYLDLEAW